MSQSNPETLPRFPPEVEVVLCKAGWYPGRLVEEHIMDQWYAISFDFPPLAGYHLMFPAAYRFLREFGGLRLGPSEWPTKEAALFPSEVEVQIDSLIGSEWCLESRLYPIGLFPSQPYYYLMIDLSGKVWGMFESMDLIGHNTDEAITNLVTGNRTGISINIADAAHSTNGYISSLVEDALRAHRKG